MARITEGRQLMDKNKTLADRLGLPQSVVETAASMDPVNKKALKGKHKDRKDKDIDNDGDVDASDKYLHKRRKAISSKVDETKGAPKGYHFTKDGKLKKGDADADGPGGKKLRSDPLDKQRNKIPPLPEQTTYNVNVSGEGGARVKAKTPTHAASKVFKKLGIAQRHRSTIKHTVKPHTEDAVDEGKFKDMVTRDQENKRLGKTKMIANPRNQKVRMVTPSRAKMAVKKGFVHAEDKSVDEARRGRPPKSGVHSTDDMEAGKHIVVQLRKAVSMRGNHHVEFKDGKKHKISQGHANKALNTHRSLRTPAEKKAFQDKLHKSHDSFHAALKDKNPGQGPKKRGVTLGGGAAIRRAMGKK